MKRFIFGIILAAALSLSAYPVISGPMTLLGVGKPSAAASGCTEATNFLSRRSGTTGNAAYTTYICGLVTDGIWAKLDALYVFGQDTQANSQLNLVSSSYAATEGAGPGTTDWAAGSGGAGGFSNCCGGYINSNFNPTTAPSPKYVQNSASYFVWMNDVPSSSYVAGSESSGTGSSFIYNESTFTTYSVNDGAFGCGAGPGGPGLLVASRTGSTATVGYRNNSVVVTGCTATSSAPVNSVMTFGRAQGASSSAQYIVGGVGSGLTGTDAANLYARTLTLLQTIAGYP